MEWQIFMEEWDRFHRLELLPFIKKTNYNTRKEINHLLTDMKSSLKWCRYNECVRIKEKLQLILNQQ